MLEQNTIGASKIERELGWTPRYDFDSGLSDIVDWYMANGQWVDGIRSGEYLRFYDEQYAHRLRSEI